MKIFLERFFFLSVLFQINFIQEINFILKQQPQKYQCKQNKILRI